VKDEAKSVQWYKRGAGAGHAAAIQRLYVRFEYGTSVVQDESRGVAWYTYATDAAGYSGAMQSLFDCYENVQGVMKGEATGIGCVRWLLRMEMYMLCGTSQSGLITVIAWPMMRPHFIIRPKTIEWYTCGTEAAGISATNRLGFCYEHGHGVAKDKTQAVEGYKRSSEAGNASAMFILGCWFERGSDVEMHEAGRLKTTSPVQRQCRGCVERS
jgi:uncharacterized protein